MRMDAFLAAVMAVLMMRSSAADVLNVGEAAVLAARDVPPSNHQRATSRKHLQQRQHQYPSHRRSDDAATSVIGGPSEKYITGGREVEITPDILANDVVSLLKRGTP